MLHAGAEQRADCGVALSVAGKSTRGLERWTSRAAEARPGFERLRAPTNCERIVASCTKPRSASLRVVGLTLRTLTATRIEPHEPRHTLEPEPSPTCHVGR